MTPRRRHGYNHWIAVRPNVHYSERLLCPLTLTLYLTLLTLNLTLLTLARTLTETFGIAHLRNSGPVPISVVIITDHRLFTLYQALSATGEFPQREFKGFRGTLDHRLANSIC